MRYASVAAEPSYQPYQYNHGEACKFDLFAWKPPRGDAAYIEILALPVATRSVDRDPGSVGGLSIFTRPD